MQFVGLHNCTRPIYSTDYKFLGLLSIGMDIAYFISIQRRRQPHRRRHSKVLHIRVAQRWSQLKCSGSSSSSRDPTMIRMLLLIVRLLYYSSRSAFYIRKQPATVTRCSSQSDGGGAAAAAIEYASRHSQLIRIWTKQTDSSSSSSCEMAIEKKRRNRWNFHIFRIRLFRQLFVDSAHTKLASPWHTITGIPI